MNDGTDEEDPREWSRAQVEARIAAFAAATRAAKFNEFDKGLPADALRREASDLPRWTRETLIRDAATLLIDKMRACPREEQALWASVLESLLGIDWIVRDNPL